MSKTSGNSCSASQIPVPGSRISKEERQSTETWDGQTDKSRSAVISFDRFTERRRTASWRRSARIFHLEGGSRSLWRRPRDEVGSGPEGRFDGECANSMFSFSSKFTIGNPRGMVSQFDWIPVKNEGMTHFRPRSSLATATRRSGSNPKCRWSSLRGAEAPNVFMPMIRPDGPT